MADVMNAVIRERLNLTSGPEKSFLLNKNI